MEKNIPIPAFCRYYHGEDKNPFERSDEGFLLWGYERRWVTSSIAREASFLSCYLEDGLEIFRANDGIPIGFKSLLYERYCHWTGIGLDFDHDPQGFKEWYEDCYPL